MIREMTAPGEDDFTMSDKDADGNVVTFNTIQDENGDYWGYGHVDPEEFIAEANRHIVHSVGEDERLYSDPAELAQAGVRVEHLYARYDDDRSEYFHVSELTGTEHDLGLFPVTRLAL